MHYIQNCLVTEEILTSWEQKFVPFHDTFFFEKADSAIEWLGPNVFLLSREKWADNKELNTLDIGTSLHPWTLKKEVAFVAVMSDALFSELSPELREKVFYEQWRLGRGQIFEMQWLLDEVLVNVPSEDHDQTVTLLKRNLFHTPDGEMVVLLHTLWWELSHEVRVQFLLAVAKLYVQLPSVWSDLSTEEQQRITALNPIIAAYTDTFCAKNGPNCLTTALAGATPNPVQAEFLLSQWMIVDPFLNGMKHRGYSLYLYSTDDIQADDVLVWYNTQGTPLHACYALGNGLVFNTNGQTMFNPWQVLHVDTLLTDWDHVVQAGGRVGIYRKLGRIPY